MSTSKKIIILGHFGVGKTSLIRKFVLNNFSESYKVTIGVHVSKKVINLKETGDVSLIIWDIEGTKDVKTIRDSYLLGTNGILYVYDTTRATTYLNLEEDLSVIRNKCPNIPIQIIGNKIDLVTDSSVIEKFTNNTITNNYLTSAKTGENVEEAFLALAKTLFKS